MKEFNEYYDILLAACRSEDVLLAAAYRRLRELLEHLCRTQMTDSSLQMTDLSARINFVASKTGLSVVEQNRLHTFRLTSNAILNRQVEPQREHLLRDAKTLAFFVKRLTEVDIPDELACFHVPMLLILYSRLLGSVYDVCVSVFSKLMILIYMYCL